MTRSLAAAMTRLFITFILALCFIQLGLALLSLFHLIFRR